MRDHLQDWTCLPLRPLRKCEWCNAASERGKDLCSAHLDAWVDNLSVPRKSSPYKFAVIFAELGAVGLTL